MQSNSTTNYHVGATGEGYFAFVINGDRLTVLDDGMGLPFGTRTAADEFCQLVVESDRIQAWIEQGYNARLMGLNRPDQITIESEAWRTGWDLADGLIDAESAEADAKPGLDAMPLPAWSDLVSTGI